MHHANHFYGHAHVMASYAGLNQVPPIQGFLQHGWNILDGFAPGTPFVEGYPKFVWSDGPMRRGWSMGRRGYQVIGSPWAYLLRLREAEVSAPRERVGTIFYPFHGWEGQEVVGDHQNLIRTIREVEGDEPVTICLYWNEYQIPSIREMYENRGFRVVCHGYRGLHWRNTDTRFLHKQLDELLRHRRVASNRLGSAIFYGASVGCEVGVYGDPMVLADENPAFGGVPRMARLWPDLLVEHVPQDVAEHHARVELGMDRLLEPGEIRRDFGWSAR